MRAVVLSIGRELVSGLRLDTHAAAVARALGEVGIEVLRHETLDDDVRAVAAALRRAGDEADVVVATGGLGPTLDDTTREALAEVMGVRLEEYPAAEAHLEAWARARGKTLSESNRRQALLPRGAEALANPIGTAVGIAARVGRARVFCLPGVPAEMYRMLAEEVVPAIRRLVADEQEGRAEPRSMVRTIRTFGLAESIVGERLADLMAPERRPHIGTAVSEGIIDVHIYAFVAPEAVEADAAEVRRRLGDAVFGEGEERLEEVVAAILARKKRTLAVAESCTGGLVAAKLVNVPGISAYLEEAVVAYSNASKVRSVGVLERLIREQGAVSEAVARAMAEGIRRRTGADIGLGLTGIAGPSGGTPGKPVGTVWFALADAAGTTATREVFAGDRAFIRRRAANHALNLLRLRLMG